MAHAFAMSKYEVTISQYTTFLNSVASVTSSNYLVNLWATEMTSDLNVAGISRSGSGTVGSPYSYSVIGPSGTTPAGASSPGNRPVAYVSWFDAARFANWVNNGATNGASTETGAYTLSGMNTGIITKNPGASWWIPSQDEWYKAAYYKGGGTNAGYWLYPTQSDTAPGNVIGGATNQANLMLNNGVKSVTRLSGVSASQNYLTDVGAFSGSASAYGTFDQGGNLVEWNDAVVDENQRGQSGGDWGDLGSSLQSSSFYGDDPQNEYSYLGFRVATITPIPEPSTYVAAIALLALMLWPLCRRRSA